MVYTVGDAAKMLNVAPSTLRYYDKEGLLPFVERSEGGIRMFKDSDLDWLKLIECLKRTGMPIKGIRQFIECTARGDGKCPFPAQSGQCHSDRSGYAAPNHPCWWSASRCCRLCPRRRSSTHPDEYRGSRNCPTNPSGAG